METDVVKNRVRQGNIASIVGIAVNILLAAGKIVAGVIFGVISVLADGLNNLTDCGSSIISMLSFKMSAKPADKEHPYGHERAEYVCSMSVAFIILLVAFETLKEAIAKIITPEGGDFSVWVIGTLAVSIVAKLGLFLYYRATAKRIESSILKASAADSLTDCVSTAVVLACAIVSKLTGFNADGYAGLLVALFIGYSAVGILRDTFSTLIGKAPDEELVREIKQRILSYPGVLGVHDLSVYSYGPNKYFASAHVEVDSCVDVLVSHELVDQIEKDFLQSTGIVLTGHLDPIVIDDERVTFLRGKVEQIVAGIDARLSMHDFRMVFGENRTNLIFDVAVPYDFKMDKDQIVKLIEAEVRLIDPTYCLVVTVEPCV